MKSLYLLVNFFTIIIPFLFSFHPKIKFNKTWGAFFSAAILVGLIFVIWDAIFTKMGVWWFNDNYILGIKLVGLPIEEILFFICIPFSCIFTYFCLDKFYDLTWNKKFENLFFILFSLSLIVIATIYINQIYTAITFYSTALACIYLKFIKPVDWIGKATTVYGILLLPFFIVNGVLTGTGIEDAVVKYNPDDFMGIRMLTIPVEDSIYGYLLILLNLLLYKKFLNGNKVKPV